LIGFRVRRKRKREGVTDNKHPTQSWVAKTSFKYILKWSSTTTTPFTNNNGKEHLGYKILKFYNFAISSLNTCEHRYGENKT
jgi:hypothetical protein